LAERGALSPVPFDRESDERGRKEHRPDAGTQNEPEHHRVVVVGEDDLACARAEHDTLKESVHREGGSREAGDLGPPSGVVGVADGQDASIRRRKLDHQLRP
jgi:hypothetical protein